MCLRNNNYNEIEGTEQYGVDGQRRIEGKKKVIL